jgi:hypothetical protein
MRTTLTIDEDVAVALERMRRQRNARFKDLVNEALRRGLRDMATQTKKRGPFQTRSVSLGRVRIGGIDNIAEALAIAEGEGFH